MNLCRKTALGIIVACAAFSALPAYSQELNPAPPGKAAYLAAIGAIAFAECPKAGFTVNPNGWHALIEHDGFSASDFMPGAKFEVVGAATRLQTGHVFEAAGRDVWCSYIQAWSQVVHPRIWRELIHRKNQ